MSCCQDGYTPLHWACSEGHLSVVEALLSRQDVDVSIKDPVSVCVVSVPGNAFSLLILSSLVAVIVVASQSTDVRCKETKRFRLGSCCLRACLCC